MRLAFYLNESIFFWLAISYQKPFVVSVSVFCSQIFSLKFTAINWSDPQQYLS